MKATKRALLASALAMLLCVSMLVGTTFAWFTDSASLNVNMIQSGTLDVALVDANGNSLEGQTIEFVNVNGSADILWEPGATFKTTSFFVENQGNLALKYNVFVNGIDGNDKLLEAIEWSVEIDGTATDLDTYVNGLAPQATSQGMVLVGHMLEEAGNEYQNLTASGISITVYATQLTYEEDIFNNQYDKDAPLATNVVFDMAGLKKAMSEGGNITLAAPIYVNEVLKVENDTVIDLAEYSIDTDLNVGRPFEMTDGASLTIVADGAAVLVGNYGLVNVPAGVDADVTIVGGTFNANTDNGAFIKVRDGASADIVLTNVNYTDNSNDGWVMNTYDAGDVNVTISGGSYTAFAGFQFTDGTVSDATVTTAAVAFEVTGEVAFDNCEITVDPGLVVGTAPAAAIAVSNNGVAYVNNSMINVPTAGTAYDVYTTGGDIVVTGCQENLGADAVLANNRNSGTITIDGVAY